MALSISITDNLTISEDIVFNIPGYVNTLSVSETVTITENISNNLVVLFIVSDLMTLSEDVDLNYSLPTPLYESITITEDIEIFVRFNGAQMSLSKPQGSVRYDYDEGGSSLQIDLTSAGQL